MRDEKVRRTKKARRYKKGTYTNLLRSMGPMGGKVILADENQLRGGECSRCSDQRPDVATLARLVDYKSDLDLQTLPCALGPQAKPEAKLVQGKGPPTQLLNASFGHSFHRYQYAFGSITRSDPP